MEKEKEMIKPSAIIAVSAKLSLIERQLWNILFYKAWSKLETQDIFQVSMSDILHFFPYDTKNYEHLKACLEKLVRTTVTYDYLGKDNRPAWGVFSLMASAQLENGVCTYSYAPNLRRRLNDEYIYTKLSLHIMMRLSSGHALVLYELCSDYRKVGHKTLSLAEFRDLMGIQETQYKEFNDLNKRVLRPALKEINEKSNLHVEVQTKRTGRKITHLKFLIGYNVDFQPEFPLYESTQGDNVAKIKNLLTQKTRGNDAGF